MPVHMIRGAMINLLLKRIVPVHILRTSGSDIILQIFPMVPTVVHILPDHTLGRSLDTVRQSVTKTSVRTVIPLPQSSLCPQYGSITLYTLQHLMCSEWDHRRGLLFPTACNVHRHILYNIHQWLRIHNNSFLPQDQVVPCLNLHTINRLNTCRQAPFHQVWHPCTRDLRHPPS